MPDEQLEWEQRLGRPAGIAATVAAACLLIGLLYSTLVGAEAKFSTYARSVQTNDKPDLVIVPGILQFTGYLLFAFGLYYLARATKARRAETLSVAIPMSIAGPVLKAITVVLTSVALIGISSEVADLRLPPADPAGGAPALIASELNREVEAVDVQDSNGVLDVRQVALLAANLALGFALVIVSLNAMRAGLLSRFIGILGIIAAVLTVLFQGAGIIEAFWLAAIGAIFLDRWPGGRGPAWETGEATPWPTAAEQRLAEEDEDGEETETETETGAQVEAAPADDDEPAEGDEPPPHPVSKKRKKKKRR